MSASERLKALEPIFEQNDEDGRWPDDWLLPEDKLTIALARYRNALPQIVAVVEAAERAEPALAQAERAMVELVWTMRDVTARDALHAALAALEEALQ